MTLKTQNQGFTIVELLIVIVVVAILTALVISAYNSIQRNARDSKRRSDINQLIQAMNLMYINQNKLPIEINAGYNNTGTGWTNNQNASYPISIVNRLVSEGYLGNGVGDPKTLTGVGSYMHYRCNGVSNKYAFFAKLENPKPEDNEGYNWWSNNSCNSTPLQSSYEMNYAKVYTIN